MQFPDYTEVHDKMVAQRYRSEEDETRLAAIDACEKKGTALELYTGQGGTTRLYNQAFSKVVTNDINPSSVAIHKLSALEFISKVLPVLADKIDLVDFDCYGCPSKEILAFFEERDSQDCPLVLAFADGLALWMKRAKRSTRTEKIRRRYILPDDFNFDELHPWREHDKLVERFMHQIAKKYEMECVKISTIQKNNYIIGSYLFTYVRN